MIKYWMYAPTQSDDRPAAVKTRLAPTQPEELEYEQDLNLEYKFIECEIWFDGTARGSIADDFDEDALHRAEGNSAGKRRAFLISCSMLLAALPRLVLGRHRAQASAWRPLIGSRSMVSMVAFLGTLLTKGANRSQVDEEKGQAGPSRTSSRRWQGQCCMLSGH